MVQVKIYRLRGRRSRRWSGDRYRDTRMLTSTHSGRSDRALHTGRLRAYIGHPHEDIRRQVIGTVKP